MLLEILYCFTKIIKSKSKMKFLFFLMPFIISTEVYICKGGSSKVYHKSDNCRGLKFCSTKVERVSEEDAIKLGRRKCKIEKNKL